MFKNDANIKVKGIQNNLEKLFLFDSIMNKFS